MGEICKGGDPLAWVWSLAKGAVVPWLQALKPGAAYLGNLQDEFSRFPVFTTMRTDPDCSFYEHTADLRCGPPRQTKPSAQGARPAPRPPPGCCPAATPRLGFWSSARAWQRRRSQKAPKLGVAAVCPPHSLSETRDSHQGINDRAWRPNKTPKREAPALSFLREHFLHQKTAHLSSGGPMGRQADTGEGYCSHGLPGRRRPSFRLPGSICHWTKLFSSTRKRVCLWRCGLSQTLNESLWACVKPGDKAPRGDSPARSRIRHPGSVAHPRATPSQPPGPPGPTPGAEGLQTRNRPPRCLLLPSRGPSSLGRPPSPERQIGRAHV